MLGTERIVIDSELPKARGERYNSECVLADANMKLFLNRKILEVAEPMIRGVEMGRKCLEELPKLSCLSLPSNILSTVSL